MDKYLNKLIENGEEDVLNPEYQAFIQWRKENIKSIKERLVKDKIFYKNGTVSKRFFDINAKFISKRYANIYCRLFGLE